RPPPWRRRRSSRACPPLGRLRSSPARHCPHGALTVPRRDAGGPEHPLSSGELTPTGGQPAATERGRARAGGQSRRPWPSSSVAPILSRNSSVGCAPTVGVPARTNDGGRRRVLSGRVPRGAPPEPGREEKGGDREGGGAARAATEVPRPDHAARPPVTRRGPGA